MSDPLSEVIALLRPRTVFTKGISGAGRWGVRYSEFGEPSFCAVLEGSCRLVVDGRPEIVLEAGDFVLLPATPGFTLSGLDPVAPKRIDPKVTPASADEVRHGIPDGPPDVRLLGGYFVLGSPDGALLGSLLPAVIHVRGSKRLSTVVRLVGEESSDAGPGRELVLTRLVEVLLIEALRTTPPEDAPGTIARVGRRPARARDTANARRRRTPVDHGPARPGRRAFALGVLRALHAHRGDTANGIPADLAHGARQGSAPPARRIPHRGRATRRLQLGKYLQHGVQAPPRPTARSLCACGITPY